MKTVDVLVRIDREQHRFGIDMLRQGQLNEDAIDGRISIQPPYQSQ